MPSSPDPALLRAIAAEVRARRAAAGLSQEALAQACGLNRTFLGKLETAANQPTIAALFKLADGLGARPGELVDAIAARYRREKRR